MGKRPGGKGGPPAAKQPAMVPVLVGAAAVAVGVAVYALTGGGGAPHQPGSTGLAPPTAAVRPGVYRPRFPKKKAVQPAGNPPQPTRREQQMADKFGSSLLASQTSAANVVELLEAGGLPPEVIAKSPNLFPMALKKYLFEIGTTGRPKEFAAMIELMLEGGANPEIPLGTGLAPSVGDQERDDMRRPLPPLWFAVEHLHIDLVTILLHYGAYPGAWTPDGKAGPGQAGWSPLQSLAIGGRLSAKVGQHMLKVSTSDEAAKLRADNVTDPLVGALVRELLPEPGSGTFTGAPEMQTGQ